MPSTYLLGVCLAAATLAPSLGAQQDPHAAASVPPSRSEVPADGAVVPLRLDSGRPEVAVTINGQGPFRLLVETGSPMTILTAPTVRRLGLADGAAPRGPRASTVDSIRIGDATLYGLGAMLFDRLPGPVDGLLGLNAFADLLVTLDYPAATLRLASGSLPEPDGREVLRATRAGPFWSVELDMAGRRTAAILDTQASGSFAVTSAFADSLAFAAAPVVVGRARGPSIGDVERRAARLAGDVRVGSAVIERPIVDVLGLPSMLGSPVLFGSKALHEFAVTLDQRQGVVRLKRTPAGPVRAPPPLRSFGMSAPHGHDGTRRIAYVLPGSPADQDGVRAGDEMVTADGRPAGELSDHELSDLARAGQPVRFRLRRNGAEREVTLMSVVQVP